MPDPAAAGGGTIEKQNAYRTALRQLENRVKLFTALRIDALDKLALRREMDRIGKS